MHATRHPAMKINFRAARWRLGKLACAAGLCVAGLAGLPLAQAQSGPVNFSFYFVTPHFPFIQTPGLQLSGLTLAAETGDLITSSAGLGIRSGLDNSGTTYFVSPGETLHSSVDGPRQATSLVIQPFVSFGSYWVEAFGRSGQSLGTLELAGTGAHSITDLYGAPVRRIAITTNNAVTLATMGGTHSMILDNRWSATASGSWDDAANWDIGYTPFAEQNLQVNTARSQIITGPAANTHIGSMRMGTSSGSGRTELRLSTGDLHADSSIELGARSELHLNGRVLGAGTMTNQGQIRGNGRISVDSLVNTGTGRLIVGNGERLVASTIVNTAFIDINGGELDALAIDNQHQLNLRGTLRLTNGLLNHGSVRIGPGTSEIYGAVENHGQISVAGGTQALFFDAVTNHGTIQALPGGSFVSQLVFFGGLIGDGVIGGNAQVEVHQQLEVHGSMRIDGTLALADSNRFLVDGAGGAVESVSVGGAATLDGSFAFSASGGGWGLGQKHRVLSAGGGINGQFDGLAEGALVGKAGGFDVFIHYGTHEVSLNTLGAPVPEPETWALMLGGLGVVGWIGRRRSSSARHRLEKPT